MSTKARHILCFLLFLQHAGAAAVTVYVTDQLQVGLHADKTVDSPIITLVPIGTALELVKTEEELSFVREPSGTGGWIDNSYLSDTTADLRLEEARARIQSLETELAGDGARSGAEGEALRGRNAQLTAELESERYRAGELQRQLAELRQRTGPEGTDKSLYLKIDQLSRENSHLENQLAALLETRTAHPAGETNAGASSFFNLRSTLAVLVVSLLLGAAIGVYVMDYLSRRRHGGFRV